MARQANARAAAMLGHRHRCPRRSRRMFAPCMKLFHRKECSQAAPLARGTAGREHWTYTRPVPGAEVCV